MTKLITKPIFCLSIFATLHDRRGLIGLKKIHNSEIEHTCVNHTSKTFLSVKIFDVSHRKRMYSDTLCAAYM